MYRATGISYYGIFKQKFYYLNLFEVVYDKSREVLPYHQNFILLYSSSFLYKHSKS